MAKDYDPDDLADNGILTLRATHYIADCLEQYLNIYEGVNNDPQVSYEEREAACKTVRKVIKGLRKGKTKYLNNEKLHVYADIIEKEALSAENENTFAADMMGMVQ